LGQTPKLVTLEWCASSAGTGTIVRPTVVYATTPAVGYYDILSYDETNCTAKTGNDLAYDATCHSRMVNSAAGYYRLRAYR
jgi:hypothetical protein